MKRYGMSEICEECKAEHMVEEVHGDYVLYSDVLREMIPRPDADEARRAIKEFEKAVREDMTKGEYSDRLAAMREICLNNATAALLRLMGVE